MIEDALGCPSLPIIVPAPPKYGISYFKRITFYKLNFSNLILILFIVDVLAYSYQVSNAKCFGANDGSVSITGIGGKLLYFLL